ncbi:hypothetical protein GY45DRAFT_1331494 [Cubamyces sp. BRFM 1775]|nr:hypothetical protein GY45DRAFT_1331494 [Cubamyces sp. BRFM 1775]
MLDLVYLVISLAALVCAQSADENPRVIDPHSQTVWTAGKVETVSWDTTGVNVYDGANRPLAGQILLGYLINSTNQYLWADEPLAKGFLLLEKQTQVIVPEVPTGTYFIALLGDSGNWSQLFKINNPSEPTGVAPPSSLVVSTVSSSAMSSSTTTGGASNSTSSVRSTGTTTTASNNTTTSALSTGSTASGGSVSSTSTATAATTSSNATASTSASTGTTATVIPISSNSNSTSTATVTSQPNEARGWRAPGGLVHMIQIVSWFGIAAMAW